MLRVIRQIFRANLDAFLEFDQVHPPRSSVAGSQSRRDQGGIYHGDFDLKAKEVTFGKGLKKRYEIRVPVSR